MARGIRSRAAYDEDGPTASPSVKRRNACTSGVTADQRRRISTSETAFAEGWLRIPMYRTSSFPTAAISISQQVTVRAGDTQRGIEETVRRDKAGCWLR